VLNTTHAGVSRDWSSCVCVYSVGDGPLRVGSDTFGRPWCLNYVCVYSTHMVVSVCSSRSCARRDGRRQRLDGRAATGRANRIVGVGVGVGVVRAARVYSSIDAFVEAFFGRGRTDTRRHVGQWWFGHGGGDGCVWNRDPATWVRGRARRSERVSSDIFVDVAGGDGANVFDGGDGRVERGDGVRGTGVRGDVRGYGDDDDAGDAAREEDGGYHG